MNREDDWLYQGILRIYKYVNDDDVFIFVHPMGEHVNNAVIVESVEETPVNICSTLHQHCTCTSQKKYEKGDETDEYFELEGNVG